MASQQYSPTHYKNEVQIRMEPREGLPMKQRQDKFSPIEINNEIIIFSQRIRILTSV